VNQRVLITGGFGYLGGRIAQEVSRSGRPVRLASRKPQVSPSWLPQAQTCILELSHREHLATALKDIDTVVHLAALNEVDSAAHPQEAYRINTLATEQLVKAAIEAKVRRFIYLSTAHVYGVPLTGHIDERTPVNPVHPYASTHLAAEAFVLQAHRQEQIEGLVFRLSNGFGAPAHPAVDRWTLLVNDLCRQAAEDQRLTLRSSGIQQRDFITLQDVGRAVVHGIGLTRAQIGDGVFNVGGECSMSVLAVTQRISQLCGEVLGYTPSLVKPDAGTHEQAGELVYDCRKFKGTGFELTGNMDEEIKGTLRLCRQLAQRRSS